MPSQNDSIGTMTPRARLDAAIRGEAVDRPPVSLWQHFPDRDQTPEDLTTATLEWQDRFHFDFVKFMPPGDYPTIDWGLRSAYTGGTGGTRTATSLPINNAADWPLLKPISARDGFNGMVVEAVRQTRAALDPGVPLLQTVFSPLTIAMKLSGGRTIEHLRAHPDLVHRALDVIRDVTRDMVSASIKAGADGLFFATQCADSALMDEVEYREFGVAYDLPVLEAAPAGTIVLLHLHGESPMFQLATRYPAHMINWHDRHAAPHLADGHHLSGMCVAGGINERTIATSSIAEVAAEAADAVKTMNGRSLVVAPGCVVPTNTPEEAIRAVLAAVAPDRGA